MFAQQRWWKSSVCVHSEYHRFSVGTPKFSAVRNIMNSYSFDDI